MFIAPKIRLFTNVVHLFHSLEQHEIRFAVIILPLPIPYLAYQQTLLLSVWPESDWYIAVSARTNGLANLISSDEKEALPVQDVNNLVDATRITIKNELLNVFIV